MIVYVSRLSFLLSIFIYVCFVFKKKLMKEKSYITHTFLQNIKKK